MSLAHECTCTDHACAFHPVNHDQGCTLCVAKCLGKGELPSCFFQRVTDDLSALDDFSYHAFARLVIQGEDGR